MKQYYDPEEFWKIRGREPMGPNPKRYGLHKQYLIPYLKKLDFNTVLEIGCGEGRVTQYLLDNCSFSKYLGVDMSKDRINMIKNDIKDWKGIKPRFICDQFQNTDISEKFDLILAVETLLHVRPEDIEKFCMQMTRNAKKHIIHMDYILQEKKYEYPELEYYNFLHDYYPIWEKLLPKSKITTTWVEPHEAFIHIEI